MEKEQKSMNVDEEELEEGKAKEGEPLAKRYGYAAGTQQSAGVSVPQRSSAGGNTASSNAPAMFKSVSDARLSKAKSVVPTPQSAVSFVKEAHKERGTGKGVVPTPQSVISFAKKAHEKSAPPKFDPSKESAYEKVGDVWYHEKGHKVGSAEELKLRRIAQAPVSPDATPEGSKFTSDAHRAKLANERRLVGDGQPVKKSIDFTHGDQMKKGFSIGGTCGLCKRISKSITENVCEDCQSSMNTTQWHTSHLG